MLIDTHCHLLMTALQQLPHDSSEAAPLVPETIDSIRLIVNRAHDVGVEYCITIGTNVTESNACALLTTIIPNVFGSVGLYPHECTETWRDDLALLAVLMQHHDKIVAIGECGLDFHYPEYNASRQKDAFKAQIELALAHDLALIIHTRDAIEETLAIVEQYAKQLKRCVFHCFSETAAIAQNIVAMGFLLGITATVTYPKNTKLRSVIETVGLDNLVLETDSPYLPPQYMRGKINNPSQIPHVARAVADILGVSCDEVAAKTTHNACMLFRLPVLV